MEQDRQKVVLVQLAQGPMQLRQLGDAAYMSAGQELTHLLL